MTSIEELLQANHNLRVRLEQIASKMKAQAGLSVAEISELFSAVQASLRLLQSIPSAERRRGPCVEPLSSLAELLRSLQRMQPSIQTALLTERSRLQSESMPLNAALAWTAASRFSR
jgi:hypothetical protein